jgi:hypothetical protein
LLIRAKSREGAYIMTIEAKIMAAGIPSAGQGTSRELE